MSNLTGLIKISSHQNSLASADVVFVHGLGGDARSTWHPKGKQDDDDFWPVWLGQDQLGLNIWSFGYQAEATNWKSNSSMPLFDQASNLLDWLDIHDISKRPLVFITHSMGGLLVKKMLRSALTFQKQAILEQTKGIVFLATPHTGSHLANLIDNISVLTQATVSVEELKAHSPQLRELNEWYRENVRSLGIATKVYYETQPVKGILVVDPDSANPGIEKVKPVAIPNNHIDLCKPDSQNSQVYLGIRKFIDECLKTPVRLKDDSNGTVYVGEMSDSTGLDKTSDHSDVLLRCLHLTDLHLGMDGLENLWPNVEEIFFNDLEYLCQKVDSLDLVMFTGDLTQHGSKWEFQQVDQLLGKFWNKFRQMKFEPKFLAVPGNHDLVRPDKFDPALINLQDLWNKPYVQEPFWNKIESPQRQLVIKAFENYVQWWENTTVPKPEIYSEGILPGDFSATIEKDGFKLGILGLNSAFLQLMGGDREGKLALDMRQFNGACNKNGPSWAKDHDVCLLLTHHPQDWLTDEAQDQLKAEIYSSPERFALHLCGHMHEFNLSSLAEGGANPRRRLQGCSLFGIEGWGEENKKKRLHGYSLWELKIKGNTASLSISPRKAEKKQHGGWKIDRDTSFELPKGEDSTKPVKVKLLRERGRDRVAQDKITIDNPLIITQDNQIQKWKQKWKQKLSDYQRKLDLAEDESKKKN
ncbi:MAG: hypothetical protein F6K26_11345 [Moorea sp. SIO2I5]|nr:hypothetical protein [Moorena sp. SIO2I5]